MEGRDYHPDADDQSAFEVQLRQLLDRATDLQVKQGRYTFEREEKKRIEAAQATIRTLDPSAPMPRAPRKDRGTKRAPKEVAA